MRRAIEDISGIPRKARHSLATVVIFVITMFSILVTTDQIATLVLNPKTVFILLIAIMVLIFLSFSFSKRIQAAIQPFLLPHERAKEISILLCLGICLISVSLVIEASFRWDMESSPIEGQVESVKPTRAGSRTDSLKIAIPAHDLNNWTEGISYLSFDTRATADRFSAGQTIPLILQKGNLGLNRVVPLPGQSFLRNRVFFR